MTETVSQAAATSYGGLAIDADAQHISFSGMALPLDDTAYSLLAMLMARVGELLAEPMICAALWPGQPAGTKLHARLCQCVATLNGTLADCAPHAPYVAHYPGQGFALVAPPTALASPSPSTRPASISLASLMPAHVIGRDDSIARIGEQLAQRRFITIVGAGGIGKTTVARALLAHVAARYPDGCYLLELASLDDGRLLPAALGAALGMAQASEQVLAKLATFLRGKRMLVLLDSCEHLTEVAAGAAEALLRAGAGIDVVATSREPLMASGEWLHRLGPMALPPPGAVLSAAEALRYPAVALFAARAGGDGGGPLVFSDADTALVIRLCRQLDGLPLALELGAALVAPLGLAGMAAQIAQRLLRPASGKRSAAGRHLTLAAMLDWSYDLLSADEQCVLRRLAVFRAGFTLDAAGAVASDDRLDATDVIGHVLELAAKSLVSLSADGAAARHRLLDTTRAYAGARLAASAERAALQARHAAHMLQLMEQADTAWIALSRQRWIERFGPMIDDVRAALDWAFGPVGDAQLAVKLTASSYTLGDQMALAPEFGQRVRDALDLVAAMGDPPELLLTKLRLRCLFCDVNFNLGFNLAAQMANVDHLLAAGERTGLVAYQVPPLTALWGFPFVSGDYPAALHGCERMGRTAREHADPAIALITLRTMAQTLHFLGRHDEAQAAALAALADRARRIPLQYNASPVELDTSMRIVLARLLWMQGQPDHASLVCAEALRFAAADRPAARCQVLGMAAIPLAFWRGELEVAAVLVTQLIDRAERDSFAYWIEWGRGFQDVLDFRAGVPDARARPSLNGAPGPAAKLRDHMATFDARLLEADASARVAAGTVGWCAPEVLRARAVALLREDDEAGAEALLHESIALAASQGALGWQLRSATSLAALWRRQGQADRASVLLMPLLARFNEGESTADLRAARALLAH